MHPKEKLQFLESTRPTKILMVMHPFKRLLKVFLNKKQYPSIFENFRIPNWVPEETGLDEELEAEESEKSTQKSERINMQKEQLREMFHLFLKFVAYKLVHFSRVPEFDLDEATAPISDMKCL